MCAPACSPYPQGHRFVASSRSDRPVVPTRSWPAVVAMPGPYLSCLLRHGAATVRDVRSYIFEPSFGGFLVHILALLTTYEASDSSRKRPSSLFLRHRRTPKRLLIV